MPKLELAVASGDLLSVRRFSVRESVSNLFSVSVTAMSEDPSLDLEAIVGKPASLRAETGYIGATLGGARLWSGICCYVELAKGVMPQPGEKPLSTYLLRIVPTLWLLTQRRGNRNEITI